jgi:formylglycine-generating enzyme required for sulfatase activity
MHPILIILHVGPRAIPIASYGVMLCLGAALAASGVLRAARAAHLDLGACIAALGCGAAGAFGGAVLLHGIAQCARLHSLSGFAHPGLAFFGGALGGVSALVCAGRAFGVPGLALIERALPALAAGHALGRIGCFLGGCCYGKAWDGPLAVHYRDALAPAAALPVGRHPVPLYEACLLFVLAVVFALRPARAPGSGARLTAYAAVYSGLRIGLETLRGDPVRGVFFGGLASTSQLVAALVLLACAVVHVRRRVAARADRGVHPAAMRRVFGLFVSLFALGAALRAFAEHSEVATFSSPATVLIRAGSFTMGSDDADLVFAVELCKALGAQADDDALCRPELFSDEQPQHRVRVGAFRIDRREVSQQSYQRCVQANVCLPPRVPDIDARLGLPEQPVTGVTWREASRYCVWLGGRLPTEAEWERAARGNSARHFPWGRAWNSRVANHGAAGGKTDASDGYDYAAPVDALPDGKSAYGLLNMAGNAWELTADTYDHDAYAKSPLVDPQAAGEGDLIVIRGGSWRSPAYTLRVTQRAAIKRDETRSDVGFRCAY